MQAQGGWLLRTEAQGLGNPGLGAAGWSHVGSAEPWGWVCPLRPYGRSCWGTSASGPALNIYSARYSPPICYGLSVFPQKSSSEVLVPFNVTVFGDKVFKEVS